MKTAARVIVALFVVAAACLLSISGLKSEVTHLVRQTLPGLEYAAQADSLIADNYIRCLNLAAATAPPDADQTLRQIDTASRQTDVYLQKYRDTIFDSEDRANFEKVNQVRTTYLRSREQFLSLLNQQHRPEAFHYLKSDVTPAYNDYSQAMSKLFKHKVEIGRIRREQVMLLSFITPIVVGILYVLLFLLGLIISFKFIVP